jgi:iron-sulfur cluster assembly accessory protein
MSLPSETITEQVAQTVQFTQTAADAARDVMEQKNLTGYALRLFISGGGCSGYKYGLALDNRLRTEDMIVEQDGIKLIVDEVSINYLRGATVDYVNDGENSGFKITNPNNLSTCSCGDDSSSQDDCAGGCSGCGD